MHTHVAPASTAAAAAPCATVDAVTLDLLFQTIAATYRAPSEALHGDLRSGAFAAAVARLGAACGVTPPATPTGDLRDLQAAHVDLFVSSRRGVAAAPYVGVAIDGEVMGPASQQLGAAFAAYGIGLRDGWRDLPDHVAAVAEGGGLLVRADATDAARDLLAEFIAPWFERSAAAVAERDESGFYGPVTTFLATVVKEVARATRS